MLYVDSDKNGRPHFVRNMGKHVQGTLWPPGIAKNRHPTKVEACRRADEGPCTPPERRGLCMRMLCEKAKTLFALGLEWASDAVTFH